ncbi:MAG: type II toxin-antitoxin system VapC family toxin [Parvularculaceae bacterium]
MSGAVVDASVAVKWFVKHDLTDRARRAFERYDLIAPSLILAEIGNAMWKYHRAGVASREKLAAVFEGAEFQYFRTEPIDEALSARALALAADLDHPVYDCYYLALSRSFGAPIISDDRRLLSKASSAGFDVIELARL